MPVSRRRTLTFAPALGLASLLTVGLLPASAEAPDVPSLRLLAPTSEMDVVHFPGETVRFNPGIFLASVGGAFEVRAERPDYDEPPAVEQVITRAGATTRRSLPSWVAPDLDGIDQMLRVEIRDAAGDLVKSVRRDFCPNGADMRTNDSGPRASRYPRACAFGPFTRGVVWGIEKGWAIGAFGWEGLQFRGGEGRYTVTVSIGRRYVELFGVRERDAMKRITIHVRDEVGCGPDDCGAGVADAGVGQVAAGDGHTEHQHGSGNVRGPLGTARTLDAPPADTMPDLVALPAWAIQITRLNGRDYIAFSATVWNSGPGPLLVEGYRRQDEDVMDAWQYFMRGDEVVGRTRAGAFAYDQRAGHLHWHFKQFATYSLLDGSRQQIGVSRKEAFCLAPTDSIDMTVPGAEWQPGSTGLGTACGDVGSIWIREVLQAGWGDTYGQYLPGQALNITDLPNGTYFVAVEANVKRLLHERELSNNRALRKITLGGTKGARTVEVAPWHGIED